MPPWALGPLPPDPPQQRWERRVWIFAVIFRLCSADVWRFWGRPSVLHYTDGLFCSSQCGLPTAGYTSGVGPLLWAPCKPTGRGRSEGHPAQRLWSIPLDRCLTRLCPELALGRPSALLLQAEPRAAGEAPGSGLEATSRTATASSLSLSEGPV